MVEKKSQVTVYVRAGDPACLATVKTLRAGGVEFAIVDLAHPQVTVPPLRQIRIGLLPVVTVGDAVWGGHLPGTLALLVAMRGAHSGVEPPRPPERSSGQEGR
jgi:glutaredoxin